MYVYVCAYIYVNSIFFLIVLRVIQHLIVSCCFFLCNNELQNSIEIVSNCTLLNC